MGGADETDHGVPDDDKFPSENETHEDGQPEAANAMEGCQGF